LLNTIPHIKLIGRVIIVTKDVAEKVIDFLKEYHAEYYIRNIILLDEDAVVLSKFGHI